MGQKYKLYNSCQLVRGYLHDAIYDLERIKFYLIPKNVADYLLGKNNNLTIKERNILKYLKNKEVIKINSVAFKNNMKSKLVCETPSIITNFILDYSEVHLTKRKTNFIVNLVEHLNIKNMQIAINANFNVRRLDNFLKMFSNSFLQYIEIVITHSDLEIRGLRILLKNTRVNKIIVVRSQKEILVKTKGIYYLNNRIYLNGQHPIKFNVNRELFNESQRYNTYYNGKLFLDRYGNIKNAPEVHDINLNIFKTWDLNLLTKIVHSSKFKKYWKVRKSICNVCSECIFRHMCVDNRTPFKDVNGYWSHYKKCNYNPYLDEWKFN